MSKEVHPSTQYALDVVSGNIGCPIGKYEKLACKRHLDDLKRVQTPEFPYVFDETRANRIFDFFARACRHVEGVFAGQPIILAPFQMFDYGVLFGWVHKDTGIRRFKRMYKKVARGNAKSADMSVIANYGMCSDRYYPPYHPELGRFDGIPYVECMAVDKVQARIVLDKAKEMAKNSPAILKRLTVKDTYVKNTKRGGHMRALSKETNNKNGLNPNIVIVDERHEHKNNIVRNACLSAFGKRPQNLMCEITTAGIDAENNPCKVDEDAIYKPILDGIIVAESIFVIIREYDPGDDVHDFALLTKANPILQIDNEYSRILRAEIIEEHNNAYNSNIPDDIREYLTKRCNLWQSGSEDKYMSSELMDKWKSLAVSPCEFSKLIKGTHTFNGDDASKCEDLTAAGFVHVLDDGRIAVSAHGFIPEAAVSRHEKTDRVPYESWRAEKCCTVTPGEVTDTSFLEKYIAEYHAKNDLNLKEICCDPYNLLQFMNQMQSRGYETVEVRQGKFSLSEATKLFRRLVMQGKIVHDGNKLLTWCISNAYQEQDSNENIKLSKKNASDTQRIDLLAAIINAMTRYVGVENKKSVYDTTERKRGLIVL